MKRRILIGTPTMDGKVEAEYANCLAETMKLCIQRGIEVYPLFICYESIIQNIRNDIVAVAMKFDFITDLMWIDADQGWKPEWVPRLLNYPVDVVGGTVRKKTDERELYNVKHTSTGPHDIPIDPATGLWIVDALGTGFLRMSRRALQVLWDNSEEYRVWEKEPSRWIFDIRPVNGSLVGEDVAVSGKLRQYGIQTHLDPSMTCSHIGSKKYVGDFQKWIANMKPDKAA